MIDQKRPDPWTERPFGLSFNKLENISEPRQRVLADFISTCSPDPATRTTVITAWVLAHWQMAGRRMGAVSPSLMLVNATGATDPVYDCLEPLITDGDKGPQMHHHGSFMGGSVDMAPRWMESAKKQRMAIPGASIWDLENIRSQADLYHAAKRTGFGSGISRSYGEAWHPEFGLLSGPSAELILRVAKEEDLEAYRQDVTSPLPKLCRPTALNDQLDPVEAHVAVFGTMPTKALKNNLIASSIKMGIPILFLPHNSNEEVRIPNPDAWSVFSHFWKTRGKERIQPARASAELPANPQVRQYEHELRSRLARLPAPYEFAVQQVVHQLAEVCSKLIDFAAHQHATRSKMAALVMEIYQHTEADPENWTDG